MALPCSFLQFCTNSSLFVPLQISTLAQFGPLFCPVGTRGWMVKARNVGPFDVIMGTAHGRCTITEKSNTTLQTRANFPPTTWQAISNALWELCCEAQIYPFLIISKHCWIICASCHFPNIITGVSFFFVPGKNLPQLFTIVVSLCMSKVTL